MCHLKIQSAWRCKISKGSALSKQENRGATSMTMVNCMPCYIEDPFPLCLWANGHFLAVQMILKPPVRSADLFLSLWERV